MISAPSVFLSKSIPNWHLGAAFRACLPFMILLAWTCLVRLPFYMRTDNDEFFFSIVAARWLEGGLPYVASFDIKPPGIFFLFAVAQALFGQTLATIKGMEICAVMLGAYGLYSLLRAQGVPRAAIWAAGLYPVYTLAMTGMSAVNMILLLPFVIYSFAAVQSAIDPQAALRRRIMMAGLSGLLIGMAGMLKQTAIFEAVAVFAVICLYGERRKLMELGAAFAAGAALPVLAFSAYFFAKGHFHDLLECVIVLAMQRTAPDVLASYGADKAGEFSFFGTLKNTFLPSVPLIFLWGGVIFAAIRRRRIVQVFPVRLLVIAAIWLGFSLIGVMFGRGLVDYYLLGLVPPMLILSAALFAHGVGNPDRPIRVLIFSALVGSATMIWADQDHFLAKETIPTGDYLGEEKVSDRLIALGLKPKNDRLLVVNRGYGIYIRTGALPASPYFYGTHLLGVFHTPSADPLGVALDARPEFIVVANPGLYRIVEQQANWARVRAFLKAHYSLGEPIQGQKDIFFIYKYRGE